MHGKFIRPKAFSGSGTYSRSPRNCITDEGLSGYGGITHVMNTNAEAMWLSERGAKDVFITFDFGSCIKLGFFCIWNFNQSDGIGAGIKKARIDYSLDGESWNLFSEVVFARADGKDNLRATNLNDGKNSPVNFNGLSARFIRITPDPDEGFWGKFVEGQIRYGLSKVRFFLFRTDPEKGEEAYSIGLNSSHNILTSEAGLVDNKLGNDEKTMWISEAFPFNLDFVFDLNMAALMAGFEYINYNVPGFYDAGIKNVSVFASLDGHNWNFAGDYCLERAGSEKETFKRIEFAGNEYARFIKLTVKGGPGTGTHGQCNGLEFRYGLGKIKFIYAKSGYYTEPAREYTALLSNYVGWTGADGIYSVSLDGNERKRNPAEAEACSSMFIFSDTFLGSINPGTGARQQGDMVNHTFAYLKGLDPYTLTIDFEYGKNGSKTHDNLLINNNSYTYWLQDCAVINNKFYTFTANVIFENDNPELLEGFRFRITGVDMIIFGIKNGKPDYSSQRNIKTPFFDKKPNSFTLGKGIFVNTAEAGMPSPDGYVYVYGSRAVAPEGNKLICARVLPDNFEDFTSYEFFNGTHWSSDMFAAAPIADDLSAELSIMPDDNGKYAYIYSNFVRHIVYLCTADTPYGPFENPKPLYYLARVDDLEASGIKKVYYYNTKAHYHLAKKNEMIISYNINTMDYESHFKNGNIYRPRFLRYREY